jgi:hypothetical protein
VKITFVNGELNTANSGHSRVTFVNGQLVTNLGITPVVAAAEEEAAAVVLTPLEQLSQDLLGFVNVPVMLRTLDNLKII